MNKLILILIFFSCRFLFSQITFSEEIIISNQNIEPVYVYPADINNDGDMDVISVSGGDHKVCWFENLDGVGTFGEQYVITSSYNIPSCVKAADLDNNLDLDVVVAFYHADMLIWFRNTDGAGNFELAQIIASDRDGAFGISVGDVDNDDDIDILIASWEDDTLCWYQNSDGLGNFTLAQIIDDNATKACRIILADLDADEDLDAIAATNFTEDKIYWFENTDGSGNFQEVQTITTELNNVLSICSSDLDNDGDIDILSASTGDDKVAWYENIDGNGTFGPQQVISSTANDAFHISVADLDVDGDDDVIVSCGVANRIVYFENLGDAGFGQEQIISNDAIFVHSTLPADFDNDSDYDLVSAFWGSDKIVWFKNELYTEINDEQHNSLDGIKLFQNYPNPFNPFTEIRFQISDFNDSDNLEIQIFNIKGKKIKSFSIHISTPTQINSITWEGTDDSRNTVSSGIYFYALQKDGKTIASKKMVLQK